LNDQAIRRAKEVEETAGRASSEVDYGRHGNRQPDG